MSFYKVLFLLTCIQLVKEVKSFVKNINIPGRSEIIKINDRYIMISPTLSPELEELYKFQQNQEINDIIFTIIFIYFVNHFYYQEFYKLQILFSHPHLHQHRRVFLREGSSRSSSSHHSAG